MSNRTDPIPYPFGTVFPINSLPGYQLVDAGIDRIVLDADTKFEACQRYYDRVDSDILFFFSDIVIQAEAMGATINLSATAMPGIAAPAKAIDTRPPFNHPRMKANGRVTRRLKTRFPQKQMSTIVYGPFTVAGQLVGEQTLLKNVVHDPQGVRSILEKTLKTAMDYADYLLTAGADILWISDPLAALLSPRDFWRFAGEHLAAVFSHFSSIPSIVHICGDISAVLSQVIQTGVSAISFDQCMDLLVVEDVIPDHITIIGNVDPSETIEQGRPDQIEAAVIDLANLMGGKSNYVMSSGCALPPLTPIENVQLFTQTARKHLGKLKQPAKHLSAIRESVYAGEREHTIRAVDTALAENSPAMTLIDAGLMRSVRKGSACYEVQKCFLPDVLLMADAFYAGYEIIRKRLPRQPAHQVDVILGTVKGDCHEIGKDLVRIFLEINGFNVLDLGVNVEPTDFIDKARSTNAPIIGLSAFITSARQQLKAVIEQAEKEGLKDTRIIVGGAAVSQGIAADIGAHGYARNAVAAVQLVKDCFPGRNCT
jgi:MtaA/CmuA family methyltransferase